MACYAIPHNLTHGRSVFGRKLKRPSVTVGECGIEGLGLKMSVQEGIYGLQLQRYQCGFFKREGEDKDTLYMKVL